MTHPGMRSPLTSIIQLRREREGFQNILDYRAAPEAGQTKEGLGRRAESQNMEHGHDSIRFLDDSVAAERGSYGKTTYFCLESKLLFYLTLHRARFTSDSRL